MERGVNSRYIGSLGKDFFKGYVLKLDYAVPSVTFYRNDASDTGQVQARSGESVIETITTSNGERSTFPVTIAGEQATARLDTGSHAGLIVSPEEKSSMLKKGVLKRKGRANYVLAGLVVGQQAVLPLRVEVSTVPSSSSKPGSVEPVVTLGYEFLCRYKTIWDYEHNTFTLLKATSARSR